jgi:uncharacterized protein
MIERFSKAKLKKYMSQFPVVIVNGGRQTGKSTLVKTILGSKTKYFTLDDPNFFLQLKVNTLETLKSLPFGCVIDEIQRLPEIFSIVKLIVDDDRRVGRFVFTGSANIFLLPKIFESMAGRSVILTMYPLANSEITKQKNTIIDLLLNPENIENIINLPIKEFNKKEFIKNKLIIGSYPENFNNSSVDFTSSWINSYLTTLVYRDIRDLSNIENIEYAYLLLRLLASQASSTINNLDLARSVQISPISLNKYKSLLESLYLIDELKPYYVNFGKRLVKSPKIYMSDPALLTNLINRDENDLETDTIQFGKVLENYVFNELKKNLSFQTKNYELYYLRSQGQEEIDFIIEKSFNELIGIEVKSTSDIKSNDYKNLMWLKANNPNLKLGILLYTGNRIIKLKDWLYAIPITFV